MICADTEDYETHDPMTEEEFFSYHNDSMENIEEDCTNDPIHPYYPTEEEIEELNEADYRKDVEESNRRIQHHLNILMAYYNLNKHFLCEEMKDTILDAIDCMTARIR